MTVIGELDKLIEVLEVEIPANPGGARGDALARQLEREMRRYFQMVEQMMPFAEIERIYYHHVKQD